MFSRDVLIAGATAVLGQGAMLLLAVVLIGQGNAVFYGLFGAHLQLCLLVLFFIDLGGTQYLTRTYSRALAVKPDAAFPLSGFLPLMAYRLVPFGLLAAVFVAVLPRFQSVYEAEYFIACLPGFLAYAANVLGLFDAAKKLYFPNLCHVLHLVPPCIAAYAVSQSAFGDQAFGLGAVFSASVIVSVALQWVFARRFDVIGWASVPPLDEKLTFKTSVSIFLYLIPGQLLARGQIVIAALFFAPALMSGILLCRQLINGFGLIVGILRRREFAALAGVSLRSDSAIQSIVRHHALSIGSSLAFTAVFFCAVLVFTELSLSYFQFATLLPVFAALVSVMTGATFSSVTQTFVAKGNAARAAVLSWLTAILALGLTVVASQMGSPTLFFSAEFMGHLAAMALAVIWIRRRGL